MSSHKTAAHLLRTANSLGPKWPLAGPGVAQGSLLTRWPQPHSPNTVALTCGVRLPGRAVLLRHHLVSLVFPALFSLLHVSALIRDNSVISFLLLALG